MARMMRMTRQRQQVLEALKQDQEFRSAIAVHQDLVDRGAQVSLATVYRNLATLAQMGKLDSVRGPDGESLYRLCSSRDHHHHLVCEACGHTEELDLDAVEPLLKQSANAAGFKLTDHDLELFGLCPSCQQEAPSS